MKSIVALVTVLALAPACSSEPAGPSEGSGFAALVLTGGIGIANRDVEDRWFLLVEGETAATLDLYFGPDGEVHWTRIPAGETRLVPYGEILGFHAGARTVVVHSWTRSVAHEVNGGVQWGAEGFLTQTVEL